MSKLCFIIVILSVSFNYAFAQATNEFVYKSIVDVAGDTDDLFVKATSWAVKHAGATNTTIQYEDKEAGRLIVKYKMSAQGIRDVLGFSFGTDHVYYFMTIDTKQDKCRIVLSDFEHVGGDYKVGFRLIYLWRFGRHAPSYGNLTQTTIHRRIDRKRWKRIKAHTEQRAERILRQFQEAMPLAEESF